MKPNSFVQELVRIAINDHSSSDPFRSICVHVLDVCCLCHRSMMTVSSVWCDEDVEATVDCLLPTGIIVPLHVELDMPLLDIKEVGQHSFM